MSSLQLPEPVVGVLIENSRKEILLVKSGKWFDKFVIPGGHIELGETIAQAAIRETNEEVGLNVWFVKIINVQELIFSKEFSKSKHFISIGVLCKTSGGEVSLDREEIFDFVWIKPEEALTLLDLAEYTRNTLMAYLGFELK